MICSTNFTRKCLKFAWIAAAFLAAWPANLPAEEAAKEPTVVPEQLLTKWTYIKRFKGGRMIYTASIHSTNTVDLPGSPGFRLRFFFSKDNKGPIHAFFTTNTAIILPPPPPTIPIYCSTFNEDGCRIKIAFGGKPFEEYTGWTVPTTDAIYVANAFAMKGKKDLDRLYKNLTAKNTFEMIVQIPLLDGKVYTFKFWISGLRPDFF